MGFVEDVVVSGLSGFKFSGFRRSGIRLSGFREESHLEHTRLAILELKPTNM